MLNGFEASMLGPEGQIISRVADVDAQLQWGGGGNLDELPSTEFQVLKMLRMERSRLEDQRRKDNA